MDAKVIINLFLNKAAALGQTLKNRSNFYSWQNTTYKGFSFKVTVEVCCSTPLLMVITQRAQTQVNIVAHFIFTCLDIEALPSLLSDQISRILLDMSRVSKL